MLLQSRAEIFDSIIWHPSARTLGGVIRNAIPQSFSLMISLRKFCEAESDLAKDPR